ncbi:ATP-binding protein [Arthrobacter sp. 7Tela_A1]|uniref:ATP-binding protein n=1 Tax=Arthrobacter sp. 7Tela_A1 TaxID=3093745 RepID=UPI003BB5C142
MSLRSQLFLLQLLIVLVVVLMAGSVAVRMQADQIRDAYEARMVGVAKSVAQLPSVIQAFGEENPSAEIQPIADLITQATGVTYVVVTDHTGIRYSHPNQDLIGSKVSTDPSVPLAGDVYVGTQTGTLGTSWRVKVPVFSEDARVIGTASVGILESELQAELQEDMPVLIAWLIAAAVLGFAGASWLSGLVWKRIYRLEPEEIAQLLKTRDAMLHAIGEGMVAVDERGNVALVNDEARRLLELPATAEGRPAAEVLPANLVAMLRSAGATDETVLAGERVLLARAAGAMVDGRRTGGVLILRDRTELHQLLQDLDGERDATSALRAQAHEFANRMHVISGLLELGHTGQAVDFIARSGHGGSLLSATTTEGITDPDSAALLMAKGSLCEEKGIELVLEPGPDLVPDGTTDCVTVLGNLMDNAMDAVGAGGSIRVSLNRESGRQQITVADDGPGIPAGSRELVLREGYSTKDPGGPGTRGFGLALVSRIACRRGGSVLITDSPEGGAQITVDLGPGQAENGSADSVRETGMERR